MIRAPFEYPSALHCRGTDTKNVPSIIFIDEIDAVGHHRGAGLGGDDHERGSPRGTLPLIQRNAE